MGIYDVHPTPLIEQTAKKLQDIEGIEYPQWAAFVKTGAHSERPPARSDWWYVRSAAILRSVATMGPIGTSKLRTKYGGKKRRGHKPAEFRKASGKIIRTMLQQLEQAGLVEHTEKGVHKGRVVTAEGHKLLSQSAKEVAES